MKHLFIINPVSGKGKNSELIPLIQEFFRDKQDEEFAIEVTKYPGHATEIVKEYTSKEDVMVYSIGGDGTLNEVVNGIVGTKSKLCIIPCGSGNDYIKSLGINMKKYLSKKHFKEYLINMFDGLETKVDVSSFEGRYFLNIASVGFDAKVAERVNKLRGNILFRGKRAYILSIISTVAAHKGYPLTVNIDGVKIQDKFLLAAWGNGKYYGGGVKILPNADNNDGMFDICLIKNIEKYKIIGLAPILLLIFILGKHKFFKKYVSFYRGRQITVTSPDTLAVNIDGEIMKDKNMEFELNSKLRVVLPRNLLKRGIAVNE